MAKVRWWGPLSPPDFVSTPWSSPETHLYTLIESIEANTKTKEEIGISKIPSRTNFPRIFYNLKVRIHWNKPSSLCTKAKASSCPCFKPSPLPRVHWLLTALFCLFSSTNLYPHKWEDSALCEAQPPESIKHTCSSMVQMIGCRYV